MKKKQFLIYLYSQGTPPPRHDHVITTTIGVITLTRARINAQKGGRV